MKILGKLCSKITSGTTPKGGKQVYVDKGTIFLRSQNVWKNKIILDGVAFIDDKTHSGMSKSSLMFNDILIPVNFF